MNNQQSTSSAIEIALPHISLAAVSQGQDINGTILGLHGWLDNLASFAPLLSNKEWLEQLGMRFIGVDWPGHGLSEHRHASSSYQLLDYVQDLYDLVQCIDTQRLIILGHSLGGSVAALFAGAFPNMVHQLILIEALGPLTRTADESIAQLQKAIATRHKYHNVKVQQVSSLDNLIRARKQNTDLSESSAKLLIERNINIENGYITWRSDPRLRLPSAMMLTEGHNAAFIRQLSMPTALLYGSQGYILKYPKIKERLSTFSHIEMVELPGGHHLHMQYPNEVITEVVRLVSL